jgi:hypothetical protein
MTMSTKDAAKQVALSAVQGTQFGGTPGALLRTGVGKVLGQYASWPMNHLEFSRKLITRAWENPRWGVPAFGMWLAMNYGAAQAAKSVGIDVSKWLFNSPAGWSGSPSLEFVQNLMKMNEESDAGRKARHDVITFPMEFIPTGVEAKNLLKAYKDYEDTGHFDPVTVMGFNKLKDPQEVRDLDDQIYYEFGFKPPQ